MNSSKSLVHSQKPKTSIYLPYPRVFHRISAYLSVLNDKFFPLLSFIKAVQPEVTRLQCYDCFSMYNKNYYIITRVVQQHPIVTTTLKEVTTCSAEMKNCEVSLFCFFRAPIFQNKRASRLSRNHSRFLRELLTSRRLILL